MAGGHPRRAYRQRARQRQDMCVMCGEQILVCNDMYFWDNMMYSWLRRTRGDAAGG